MDRRIAKKRVPGAMIAIGGLVVGVLLVVGYFVASGSFLDRSLHVKGNRLSIAEATKGTFEDYIPVRARVAPLNTVFLDAVQGGRVEAIFVEDGVIVEAGQAILRLSNSDLQLSVMSTESRVIEQLNAMREQELRLEQNRLDHKRELVELNYNIGRLKRELVRKEALVAKGHISQSEYDGLVDELEYLQARREVTLESQASDEKLMAEQLEFFREKTAALEKNLALARNSLDELTVTAPVAGRLSGFNMEIGQNVSRGERIGQVSKPDSYRLVADIDEYYLGRVDLGQQATFEHDRSEHRARVTKIYPNVRNGQFEVDLELVGGTPAGLRRGQTLQSKLVLGDPNEALLVPNGPFFQDTGGQWMFVVNSAGTEAYKRNVRLGRRNNRYIEVLEGLEPGEKVVTSSYSGFREMDRLKLDQD